MSAAKMLAQARKSLGWGEPNAIHAWYGARNGAYFKKGSTPWCDMGVTYWAAHSGNYAAVCHGTDFAYTVWHGERFDKHGEWHSGTSGNVARCRPGDVVFFDWSGSKSISKVDHVGVVERVLPDGRVQTIEGNTGDACKRRVRSHGVIAGYGRPAYGGGSGGSGGSSGGVKAPAWPGRYLTQPPMMSGSDVRRWQQRMRDRGWQIDVDGVYGPGSESTCRAFQAEKGLTHDGVVGPITWATAWTAPIT